MGLVFYKPSDWSNVVVYKVTSSLLLIYSLFVLYQIQRVNSEPTRDKAALLAFISQIPHADRLKWNRSDSACNWAGVKCDSNKSHVYKLQIPGTGLMGPIPPKTLANLTQLRVLSLHANKLTSPLPPDFSNLKLLRGLYLQNNKLSGDFPPSLCELTRLTRLYISGNNFSGSVPKSLNKLTRLTKLLMQNNHFSGPFPDINPKDLTNFNVSNNNLSGSIPTHLTKFPLSSFSGNIYLCGRPLKTCPPNDDDDDDDNEKSDHHHILSKSAIIAIAVAAAVVLILVILCMLICYMKNKQESSSDEEPSPVITQPPPASTVAATRNNEGGGRGEIRNSNSSNNNKNLVFVKGGEGYDFDLEALLRASAEVLGKGSVGASYKAVLEEGPTVVVKRLQQQVLLNEGEFQMQMEALGRMDFHHHLLPLRAFYFSKDEKLLVSDYLPAGSLSARLHGSGGLSGRQALDWESRIRIATTAARGLAHLHESGNIVHGNIKSSNILLHSDESLVAAVSDYGLNSLFDESPTPGHRIAGYRAPEVMDNRTVTFKSDVFSFGVLLLEILTGKAPNQATLGDEAIDLPRWVQSVVSEEWTSEIFDAELMRYDNNNNDNEEEMMKLLQMAMALVATVPDQRPTMPEVVRMLEDLNNRTKEINAI